MAAGAYTLLVEPPENYLNLRLPPLDPNASLPEDQIALRADIYSALFVLRQLDVAVHPNVQQYAKRLSSIAILGLCGAVAQTDVAAKALEQLKCEVVDNDGQLIKNRYARMMGWMAAIDALLGAYLFAAIKCNYWPWFLGSVLACLGLVETDLTWLRSYMFAWGGALVGAWVSFIWRHGDLAFNDLGRIRPNWVTAQIRLLYTAIQTLVIGLLMHLQVLSFQLGKFDTKEFPINPLVALLVGVLCGYSEKLLPLVITSKADALFGGGGAADAAGRGAGAAGGAAAGGAAPGAPVAAAAPAGGAATPAGSATAPAAPGAGAVSAGSAGAPPKPPTAGGAAE